MMLLKESGVSVIKIKVVWFVYIKKNAGSQTEHEFNTLHYARNTMFFGINKYIQYVNIR